MSDIPTAEQFLSKHSILVNKTNTTSYTIKSNCKNVMIEFAKIHVEQALKEASSNLRQASGTFNSNYSSQKQSILNAYPLDLIK